MPVSWQARGQLSFLQGRVGEFKAAQRARKGMKKFYKTTFTDFFELYPNPESEVYDPPPVKLTKKGKVSKRQPRAEPREVKKFETQEDWMRDRERKIRAWFYNHTSKARHTKARLKLNVNIGSAARPRVLSEANLYSKKYYLTRVKSKVETELKDVEDPAMRLEITRRCLQKTWNAESNAVKTEIRELRKKLLKERKAAEELVERIFSGEQDPEDIEPEEYLLVQESIDEIIDEVLDLIATRTGWAVSLNIGGPDVSKVNGEITVKTYHVGCRKGKDTFWSETPNYDDIHAKPFRNWCRKFFPESTRLRRAVDIDEKKVKNPQALIEAGRGHGHLVYVETPDSPEEVAARESRIAAEKAKANATAGDTILGENQVGADGEPGALHEGDEEDEDGVEGENLEKEDEVSDENLEKEDEDEMTWIYTEDGIPVPAFVTKGAATSKAPERPPVDDPTTDSPSSAQIELTRDGVPQSETYQPPEAQHYPTHPQLTNLLAMDGSDTWKWGDPLAQAQSGCLNGGVSLSEAWGMATGDGGAGVGSGFATLSFTAPTPLYHMNGLQTQNPTLLNFEGGSASFTGGGNMGVELNGGMRGEGGGGGLDFWAGWNSDTTGIMGVTMGMTSTAWGTGRIGGVGDVTSSVGVPGVGALDWTVGATVARDETAGMDDARNRVACAPGLAVASPTGAQGGMMNHQAMVARGDGEASKQAEKPVGGVVHVPRKETDPTKVVEGGRGGQESVKGGQSGASGRQAMGSKGVDVKKRKAPVDKDDGTTPAGQRTKRLRHAPAAIELPEWIDLAYGHLKMGMTHEGWLNVVELWYRFEKGWAAKGMSQSGRMPTAKRPAQLGAWLPAPRQYGAIPKIENMCTFADEWLQWWVGIQPESRRGGEGGLPKPLTKDMSLSSLKKGGGLGLVIVLIGLRWWGESEELANRWEQVVEDMETVFRRFQEGSVSCVTSHG